jgi:hypothetical protein
MSQDSINFGLSGPPKMAGPPREHYLWSPQPISCNPAETGLPEHPSRIAIDAEKKRKRRIQQNGFAERKPRPSTGRPVGRPKLGLEELLEAKVKSVV